MIHFFKKVVRICISFIKSNYIEQKLTGSCEITIFKSNGLAVQDAATAKLVYDKAVKAGVGQTIEI